MVELSEFHRIELAEEFLRMVEHPPLNDFGIRSIGRKSGSGSTLVQMQLVISGRKTRDAFPRAGRFPVHFLKTYYPTAFHQDPRIEYDNTLRAAAILDLPAPIGYDRNSIRTCFIPGVGYERLCPPLVEPPHQNIEIARKLPLAQAIGLWRLLEDVFLSIELLHARNFFHRDMELHNIIVCQSPLRTFLIDFETADSEYDGTGDEREARRAADLVQVARMAVYLQCALGGQESPLGQYSRRNLDSLFADPASFRDNLRDTGTYID